MKDSRLNLVANFLNGKNVFGSLEIRPTDDNETVEEVKSSENALLVEVTRGEKVHYELYRLIYKPTLDQFGRDAFFREGYNIIVNVRSYVNKISAVVDFDFHCDNDCKKTDSYFRVDFDIKRFLHDNPNADRWDLKFLLP